jgi:membrane-associated phospholipid phosphatase
LSFRWMMTGYASAIILSTVYLEIHWLVDVFGGLILGAGSVRLTDWLVAYVLRQRVETKPNVRSIIASPLN